MCCKTKQNKTSIIEYVWGAHYHVKGSEKFSLTLFGLCSAEQPRNASVQTGMHFGEYHSKQQCTGH